MAQIIKHRRGQLTGVKDLTTRNGEFIIASGSISDLNGPFVFIGSPNGTDEGVAGAFKSVSKVYQGTTAPTITAGTYGSILDGTPFYASGNESLYILNNDGSGGNTRLDLTGNIEGNLISGVTINNLTGTTANITNVSGSFTGSGQGLYNIPASGITGLELNRISEGLATASISEADGLRINTDTEVTGSLTVTGDANIFGDIILGGNITVGDSDTDFVTFGADISSSIIPDVHNSFDLGSSDKNWRNIHVSGTAYVDTLEAQQVNFNDLGILTDLTVSGSTYLGNGGDITVISGSVYNDQLTDSRIVIVGPQGLLEDDANFTFSGTELNVGQGNFTVQQSSGNIDTAGTLNVGGNTTLEGTLVVTGSSEFKNNIGVAGTLNVTGSATLKSTLEVQSTVGLNSTLDVTGSTTLKSTLEVGSTSELKGNVGMNGTLDVTGSAQFKSTINVDGIATVSSSIVEDLTDNRIVIVGTGGALEDDANFTFDGTNFTIGQGLMTIDVADGDIRTSGSITSNGLTNNGDLTVNGVLSVTGNTQLQANLYVSGNLEVLGSSTEVHIQSQVVEIDDNIIRLNAYSPFQRYAGFEVMDSGSSGVSASLVWDSLNDYWMFVSASGESSKLIGTTAGTYGSEVSLTSGTFPIASGNNSIGDSLLTYSGTTLAFNTNKFTIDSSNGDTTVSGNFTLSYSGGTDNGTKTSGIMFRNSSNVVGFVSTTETTDVLDGILGYKNSDGGLVFSRVIDGGTY
jgi:hypothetical protein